ncbi:MAG: hypothetical protein WC476_07340 [Phycisphaerae bacterium]|jgi:hypothetical protein
MAGVGNIFNIKLRIDNKPIETTIKIVTEGPETVNLPCLGRDCDISYPYVIVNNLSKPKLIISAESSSGRVPKDILEEFLLFVTPRIAEIIINREYVKIGGWGFSPLVETVECNDFGIKPLKDISGTDKNLSELIRKDSHFHLVKENVAGETYDQRSRLCYEDLCRFILKRWRDPHFPKKKVYPGEFRSFSENRRIYENNEVNNVFEWAIGDDYLIEVRPRIETNSNSIYVGRGLAVTFWKINGSKIKKIEQKLSKGELGLLPQIAGQINLNRELDFVGNGNLRAMVERDCKEVNAAAKAGAAKSVIVLCGSIVEALLYDLLKTDEVKARRFADNLASKGLLPKLPQKELNQWAAEPMILISHEMYPKKVTEDACRFANVLRDYRNLIHPGKEDREKITFDQNIASIAISVVNLIISGLEK